MTTSVDAVVQLYLLKKGYTNAAAALALDAPTVMNPAPGMEVTADLVLCAVKGSDPTFYEVEYKSFRSFAIASLDIVKGELFLVLFPVFLHCYIGLVRQGFSDEARQFWCSWEGDHIDRFPDELRVLSMLTVPEQLEDSAFLSANPFVHKVCTSRFSMCISGFCYGLLTNYVMQNNLLLVASIMNDHFTFEKISDPPGNLVEGTGGGAVFDNSDILTLGGGSSSSSSGDSITGDGSGTDGDPYALGVQRQQQMQSLALFAPGMFGVSRGRGLHSGSMSAPGAGAVVDLKEDPLYAEWLRTLVLPRVFVGGMVLGKASGGGLGSSVDKNAAQQQTDAASDRLESDKKKIARFQASAGVSSSSSSSSGSSHSSPYGNPLDPSVIFATATNAHQGLTCMHVTRGVSQAAAGFKDSCVRVWRLDDEGGAGGAGFGRLLPNGVWTLGDVLPKGSARSSGSKGAVAGHAGGDQGSASEGKSRLRPMLELWGHTKDVYAVCQQDFSSGGGSGSSVGSKRDDGRLVLSSSADESIRLWDTAVKQCVGKYPCGECGLGPAWGLAWSPLGCYFASAHHGMAAAVYSTDREVPLRLLTGHLSDVNAVCWHENATLVATCSDDRTARLFDIRTGKSVRLFGGSPSALSCVALTAFSASGGVSSLLAAGSDMGAVTVWDVGTGRRMSVLGGHKGAVHSVAFSTDASALATGGADCSVRVYGVQASVALAQTYSSSAGDSTSTSATAAAGYTNLRPPRHTFFTKYSPVFHLNYTDRHLLYAGGPFSLDSAIAEATATEQETASLLGLSQAVLGT